MEYVSRFLRLVELERKSEITRHMQEITELTASERRVLGRCEFYLKGTKAPGVFHYTVVKFIKEGHINTRIGVGDLILVSKGSPLESETVGTVTHVSKNDITAAFEHTPPKWIFTGGLRIDLYSNDIPYRRMQDNLRHFSGIKHPLKSVLLGERPMYYPKPVEIEPYNEHLNPSQVSAIANALGTRDGFLIHGPPGTGKTTTLVELIFQAVLRRKKVLATAESNTAADNILMKLSTYPDLKIVRIGHPARIVPGFENFSLHAHFQNHPLFESFQNKWSEISQLKGTQKKFQKPIPRYRRGMTDAEICQKGRSGKGAKGVKGRKVGSMYAWLKHQHRIDDKVNTVKELEQKIFADILAGADVVIGTNCMVGSDLMTNQYFDLAVIDEGSQQVEPSSLIPLMKARRFVMAGDDQQLPPTIINPKAQELQSTLFERLKHQFPENVCMLQVQYRMNDQILAYPKSQFYQEKLISDQSVAQRSLMDLIPEEGLAESGWLSPQFPVVFDDTTSYGSEAFESQPKKSASYENAHEAEHVKRVIDECFEFGLKSEHIGVITPYQAQVRLINRMLGHTGVEINSVDGFQGREKEVIIISFVRANPQHNLGFLQDLRRLNVAITRAKRKLIIIAHGETLKAHPVYDEWLSQLV